MYVCCFTGHRRFSFGGNERHPECVRIKDKLREQIVEAIDTGHSHFIAGGALGVDTWAARIVLELRREYPRITLEIAIPCKGQASKWNASDRAAYEEVCYHADKVTMVTNDEYVSGCMQRRNRYMVDKADLVIAVFNGTSGGTAQTIRYAGQMGKNVKVIDV